MMRIPMDSVVRRNFRDTPHFFLFEAEASAPPWVSLHTNERITGWYVDPVAGHRIYFTDRAIYWSDGESRVPWDSVVDYHIVGTDPKRDSKGVRIATEHGWFFVPMAGSHGPENQCRDAFALGMVLRVVVRHNDREGRQTEEGNDPKSGPPCS